MKNSDRLFPEFVGNQNALQQLSVDIAAGRFPHALLIEGPAGSGKKTLARLLAKAAVCENENRPCGLCAHCRKATAGIHPDIEEFAGDGGNRSFHVDRIRDLRENAYVKPNEAAVRVFILCDAQNMTLQAQNALLKILEEPPKHLLFMLTCENHAQLLPTICSRVQSVRLSGVEWEQAEPFLKERLPDADEQTLKNAFAVSGGVLGRALTDAADDTLKKVLETAPKIASALLKPREWDLMQACAALEKDKAALSGVLNALQLIFRDALILHHGGESTLSAAPETAAQLAQALSGRRLTALVQEIEQLQQAQLRNMNGAVLLTRLCARLRAAVV